MRSGTDLKFIQNISLNRTVIGLRRLWLEFAVHRSNDKNGFCVFSHSIEYRLQTNVHICSRRHSNAICTDIESAQTVPLANQQNFIRRSVVQPTIFKTDLNTYRIRSHNYIGQYNRLEPNYSVRTPTSPNRATNAIVLFVWTAHDNVHMDIYVHSRVCHKILNLQNQHNHHKIH